MKNPSAAQWVQKWFFPQTKACSAPASARPLSPLLFREQSALKRNHGLQPLETRWAVASQGREGKQKSMCNLLLPSSACLRWLLLGKKSYRSLMPKWDHCGQSNLLGSEGNKEDGEGAAYCKTARVLNKHLLRRPINARSGARHGEEGWRYGPWFVLKSQWHLGVEIWVCQRGRKSQKRRKGERRRWGRERRDKGWSRSPRK